MSGTGVGGCFVEVPVDCFEQRTQHDRVKNTVSCKLELKSGVPQGSLVGSLLLCVSMKNFLESLKLNNPYKNEDDLKILA